VTPLTLFDRCEIAKAIWPETEAPLVMNKAADVYSVEIGAGVPWLSQKDRERIEEEIAKREKRP
jgi:hypothetical protein